ncbi:MAG TPA: phospholipase, partial [Candidatus Dormibacteraeota bacterium]
MGLEDSLFQIDRGVGDGIARIVRRHHARRLGRIGSDALRAPAGGWAEDAPPPRRGNELDVLIDGQTALRQMLEDIHAAVSHVHLTGWYLSPDFVMDEGDPPVVVRDLLADATTRVDVRVLLWAGAPVPVFRPSRRLVQGVRDELRRAGAIHCALDNRERPLHCHHEKMIVIDDRVAFVGGIDLTALGGDRFDTSDHVMLGRLGWHDASSRVGGPA